MERAIIYYAKTGLEATDHFVPKLLEKYCQDNGYEIVAMLSEPASTEGVSFPMKYAIIGLNMEEDVNTIPLRFWRRPPQSNYPPNSVLATRVRTQIIKGPYFNSGSTNTGVPASKPPAYPTHQLPKFNVKL